MAQKEALPIIHFYCRKCDEFKVIRAMGTVVSGPVCPQCRRPMKQIRIVQTELQLFPKEKTPAKNENP